MRVAPIMTSIKECILLYYANLLRDPHHRYRSWERCCFRKEGLL